MVLKLNSKTLSKIANYNMVELVIAGMLKCMIAKSEIEENDLLCYYECVDGTKEFARTDKQYTCPKVIYEDREPIPFRERYK